MNIILNLLSQSSVVIFLPVKAEIFLIIEMTPANALPYVQTGCAQYLLRCKRCTHPHIERVQNGILVQTMAMWPASQHQTMSSRGIRGVK